MKWPGYCVLFLAPLVVMDRPAAADVIFSNDGAAANGNHIASALVPPLRGGAMHLGFPITATNIWLIETLQFQINAMPGTNVSGRVRVWDDWNPSTSPSVTAFSNLLLDVTLPATVISDGSGYRLATFDLTTAGAQFTVSDTLIAVDVELTINGVPADSINGPLFRRGEAQLVGSHVDTFYHDHDANGVLTGEENAASIIPPSIGTNWGLGMIIQGQEIPDPFGLGLVQGVPVVPEPGVMTILFMATSLGAIRRSGLGRTIP